MAKVTCFICNRKVRPKDALKRHNKTFDRQVWLCDEECYKQEEILDEKCKDMDEEEVMRYIAAVNRYFPSVPVQYSTCLDCREYKSSSCEGFFSDPLECMEEKARRKFSLRFTKERRRRW